MQSSVGFVAILCTILVMHVNSHPHNSDADMGSMAIPWRKIVVNTTNAPAAIGPCM
jgi:hypothetical protein